MLKPECEANILNRRYDAVQALTNILNTEVVDQLRRNLGRTKNVQVD
jgi:hypothetical protein